MALSDEVTSRIPSQLLVELTNVRDATATSALASKLTQASTSVQAWFQVYVQKAYDSTDTRHVEVAVDGVVAILKKWGSANQAKGKEAWDEWVEAAKALKATDPRARIVPQSTSVLTPSTETSGARPDTDRRHFDDIVPRKRISGTTPSATPGDW